MSKFKEIISDQQNQVKSVISKFMISWLCVCLSCFFLICDNHIRIDSDIQEFVGRLIAFFVTFGIGSMMLELIREKREILLYVINGVISFIIVIVNFDILDKFGTDNVDAFIEELTILYFLVILGIIAYKFIRLSKLSFAKYFNAVIVKIVKVGLVVIAVNIGFFLILSAFDELIFHIDEFDLLVDFEMIMCAVFYFPYSLICVMNVEEYKGSFFKNVITFIFMPIVFIAFLIVYIYILKIIFTLNVPKNEAFAICATSFFCGVVIWTMAGSFIEGKDTLNFYDKMIKYAKYLYIPLLILEIYCMGVRISQYGLTKARYYATMFIAVQILYIFWDLIWELFGKIVKKDFELKGRYEHFIFVGICMYVVSVMLPFTNYEYRVYRSQSRRLEKSIANEELNTIESSYRTLRYNKYADRNLDRDEIEKTIDQLRRDYAEIDPEYYEQEVHHEYDYIRYFVEDANFDISGYSKIYHVQATYYDDADYNTTKVKFIYNNQVLEVNLKDAIDFYNNLNKNNDYRAQIYEMMIDNNNKLVITGIRYRMEQYTDNISELNVEGYILTK